MDEGIITGCSFTPNDLDISLEFHDLEYVGGTPHRLGLAELDQGHVLLLWRAFPG